MPKSPIRSVNELPEMLEISGNTVRQVSLEICPDPFIGIKFRRIAGKVNGVDARISSKEPLGELGRVERTAVPEEDKRASDLAAEEPEELSDLLAPDVSVGIKTGAETEVPSPGRDRDRGDGRDLCPLSGDNERWGFSSNRPGSSDVGDEGKSALIEENKVSFKPFGLFLYGAKRNASSDEWLSPCVPGPASAASERSSLKRPSDSTSFRYRVVPGISCVRFGRCASGSRDSSKNRLPRALSPALLSDSSSAPRKEAALAQDGVSPSNPLRLSCDRLDTSGLRNLRKLPLSRPPNGTYAPFSVTEWPDAVGLPMFGDCHEVSLYPPCFPPIYRLDFVSINR